MEFIESILNNIWIVFKDSVMSILIEMTRGNFSFLILIVGIWQVKLMKDNQRRLKYGFTKISTRR